MERPRLAVYKSNTRLVAQIIDDAKGTTIVSVSSASEKGKTPRERAEASAKTLAKNAKRVSFDYKHFVILLTLWDIFQTDCRYTISISTY